MIIKSHIRGGFRDAAAYLKEQGENEYTRLVEMSDPHVKNLDEAFRAMWAVSDGTKVKKALHHVSINPMKDERLTDKQVRRICKRLEEKYGYAHGEHQRVIVEHIKDGRQHFHVIWSRVNLKTGKPHYPYMHKKQSKIAAREIETELGLKKPTPRRKTGTIHSKRQRKIQPKRRTQNFTNPVVDPQFRPHTARGKQFVRRPSRSLRTVAYVASKPPNNAAKNKTSARQTVPHRPMSHGSMSKEQQADFVAACEGKITWRQYFQKWSGGGFSM